MLQRLLFLIFLSFTALFPGGLRAGGVRLLSMGNLQFTLPDTDNQLNFYDFGGNPAGLQADQKFRWMRVYLHAGNHWGGYRPLYEPENEQNYALTFEGVKALNAKETFWGQITYLGDYPHSVYRSLEKQPYAKNFILTDTTTGNYWYNGPIIRTIYSRKLPLNFALGLAFNYKVQMGLKDVYTKVESIQREIFPGIGLSWGLQEETSARSWWRRRGRRHHRLQRFQPGRKKPLPYGLGIFVYPYDNKTRLTAVKEMQDAVVYRQIGLVTRFRQVRGKYVREYRTKGLLVGGQIFAAPFPSLRAGILHSTWAAGTRTTDNLFVQRGFEQQIRHQTTGRVVFNHSGWQVGAQVKREAFEDWSKSIEYGCLYGEESWQRLSAGLGIGADRVWLPVAWGVELSAGQFRRSYRDYLSHQRLDTERPEWQLRGGLELPLFSGLRVRAGGNWGRRVPNLFYLYEREKMWEVTGGLTWQAPHFRLSLLGIFHSRLPDASSALEIEQPLNAGAVFLPTGKRQRASLLLLVQLWGK